MEEIFPQPKWIDEWKKVSLETSIHTCAIMYAWCLCDIFSKKIRSHWFQFLRETSENQKCINSFGIFPIYTCGSIISDEFSKIYRTAVTQSVFSGASSYFAHTLYVVYESFSTRALNRRLSKCEKFGRRRMRIINYKGKSSWIGKPCHSSIFRKNFPWSFPGIKCMW